MRHLLQKSKKTLYTQILFVILAFVAMVVLSHAFMSSIVRGGLIRTSEGVLDYIEGRAYEDMQDARRVLESFSENVRLRILRGDDADMLNEYFKDTLYYKFLTDESGIGVTDFYGYFESLPGGGVLITGGASLAQPAENPKESEWYRLAVEGGGDVVETSPVITTLGEKMFTYAKRISDDDGNSLGVVCLDVRIGELGDEIVSTALNQGGYGILLNRELLILAHPNAPFVGRYASDPEVPLSVTVADDLLAGIPISEKPMTSYKGEDSVVFFSELDNGWFLGLVTPKSQYYANMNSMMWVTALLGLGLAAVLIFILIQIDARRAKSDDENQKKSMFLANMSHEIRTPINAIVGMTTIGRAAGSLERKDYCFTKIDSASKHLLGVINDILDISKIEANKIELSPADFSFEKMLQQAVNVANFRADEKHQKLTVKIDKTIPRILFADDQRLAQVITNLLSNAIKFTPDEGRISLKTALVSEENEVFTIKIEVKDNGIGMSPEQQSKLFRPFQQAESSTTRKYGGTGLGLAISKSIVEMMGGRIWAESEPGKGTTMAFTVKVKRGVETHFDLHRQGVNWENVRILAVDDDPDILMYFNEIVSGFGAKCDAADSAHTAMQLIEANGAYNIYFVDLRMPDVDGISLTKIIREKEINPGNSVVIMISSADLSSMEQDAKKAGVNKFLLKPLFPSSIADVISECIGIFNEKSENAPLDISGIFAERRILFAEDVEINREIVLALLEPTLVGIDCAENGVEAVKMFNAAPSKYDMIFMDVQMPEMDGYEATRQIRALKAEEAASVPIIAMTANVFREDVEACLEAGMNGHLGKPLDMDDMLKVMCKYLVKDSIKG